MDVDVSEEEESEDDRVIEGCNFLEINMKGFLFPDAHRIYDALEARYRAPVYPYLAPAVVIITGQPGIGKRVWIYYSRRCLAEKKPIIWYYRKKHYLFVEEGVYKVHDFHDFEVIGWTLVDSDDTKDGVPENLVMQDPATL